MPSILVVGAGKSSTCLIEYLLYHVAKHKWNLVVADLSQELIEDKIGDSKFAKAAPIDITIDVERQKLVKDADLVVSILPPHLHILLAKDCLQFKKHLITSSYISPEIKEMDEAVKEAGLMFMCEMGLDPGLDHMTASQIIHSIQKVASTVTSFKSYCGGLIAPESDNNPWHYKFNWNPKNVVNAGIDGAKYLLNGREINIEYEALFDNNKKIKISDLEDLVYYPNRDSLKYLETYDIPEIKTFLRATVRHSDFCKGWNALVKLGLTNREDQLNGITTYAQWIKNKTAYNNGVSLEEHVANKLEVSKKDKTIDMIRWLDVFEEMPIKNQNTSSADLLLQILQDKWKMAHDDKDMVVMQHDVAYHHYKGGDVNFSTTMIVKGDNSKYSAMAKTVGLPMGVFAKMVMAERVEPPIGVHIPNMVAVYRPVLNELKHHGINFEETVS